MTVILPARPAPERIGVTVLTLRLEFVFLLDILRLGYSMFTSPWAQKGSIKWTSDGNRLSGPLLRASSNSELKSLGGSLPQHPEDYFVDAALTSSIPVGLDLQAGCNFRPADTSIATESPYSTCDAFTPPPSSPVRQGNTSFNPGDRHPALDDGGIVRRSALHIPRIPPVPYSAPKPAPELPDALLLTGGPGLPQTVPPPADDSLSAGYAMREGPEPLPALSSRAFDNAPLHDALDAATTRYTRQKPDAPRKLLRQEASNSRRSTTSAAIYVCPFQPLCKSTFTRQFNLKNHIRSHKDAREFTCQLKGCRKRFNTAALCSSHGKRCH
ncbi:hypothetical protein GGF50DRAFT_92972 [Schizophyllum commune]